MNYSIAIKRYFSSAMHSASGKAFHRLSSVFQARHLLGDEQLLACRGYTPWISPSPCPTVHRGVHSTGSRVSAVHPLRRGALYSPHSRTHRNSRGGRLRSWSLGRTAGSYLVSGGIPSRNCRVLWARGHELSDVRTGDCPVDVLDSHHKCCRPAHTWWNAIRRNCQCRVRRILSGVGNHLLRWRCTGRSSGSLLRHRTAQSQSIGGDSTDDWLLDSRLGHRISVESCSVSHPSEQEESRRMRIHHFLGKGHRGGRKGKGFPVPDSE